MSTRRSERRLATERAARRERPIARASARIVATAVDDRARAYHRQRRRRTPFDDPARARRAITGAARRPDVGMETFRIEVGHAHGVKPGNIVGAIANEAELESRYIGRIDIRDDHSLVDLPEGMPKELLKHLKKVWVSGPATAHPQGRRGR